MPSPLEEGTGGRAAATGGGDGRTSATAELDQTGWRRGCRARFCGQYSMSEYDGKILHDVREVDVEDSSGTMVNTKFSDLPINLEENRNKLDEKVEKLEIDLNSDSSSATSQRCSSDQKGVTGSSEEIACISIYQKSVDVLNQHTEDVLNQHTEDISFLHLIIQTLWNLRSFRDEFLKRPPVRFQLSHDGPCTADILYEIFFAWEKNDHNRIAYSLTSLKNNLCQISNDSNIFQKLRARKTFASGIVDTILKGLHMSEAPLHFGFNSKIERQVVYPTNCNDCICQVHHLFGMKFHEQMSCRCGTCLDENECTTIFHKLDMCSPQTTKIKSFAELPVLMDELLCYEDKCECCGSLKNIDRFLSNTPHFFTIVLNWLGGGESQVSLSVVLAGITSPLDFKLLYKGVDSAAKYTLASMIYCSEGRYVCIGRDQNKWLVYDTKTVEAEDSWEHVLHRYTESVLRPEVLFFEVIK